MLEYILLQTRVVDSYRTSSYLHAIKHKIVMLTTDLKRVQERYITS